MSRSHPATHGDGNTATVELQPLACEKHPDTELEVVCRKCDPEQHHAPAPALPVAYIPAATAVRRRHAKRVATPHRSTGKFTALNTRGRILAFLEGRKAINLPGLGVGAIAKELGDTSHKGTVRVGMMLKTLAIEGAVRKKLPPGQTRGATYEART